MELNNSLALFTSPSTQPTRKPHRTASLALRQRPLYGRPRRYNTGKELDSETGLYYYGARYLDPRVSRWLSGDPAMGEYVPQAPVSDEAKKRNENLPGMGGVFNYVNLHAYHYAGNNPVKYTDPDGREDVEDFSSLLNTAITLGGNISDLLNRYEITGDTNQQNISGDDITQFQNNLTKMGEAIKEAPVTSTVFLATSLVLGAIALDNKDAIEGGIDLLKSCGIDVMALTITFESTKLDAKLTVGGISSVETNIRFDSRNSLQIGLEIGFERNSNGLRVNNNMDVSFTRKIGR
jgi:RHS repeat-associated protein